MPNNSLSNTKINITYASLLHANGVELPATGQEDIYDGTGNKSSLKLGRSCNGATICGPVVINGSLSADNITTTAKLSTDQLDILGLINIIYPVNSVIFTQYNNPPGDYLIGTTWTNIAAGRFIGGVGTGTDSRGEQRYFDVGVAGNNATYGVYSHQLTENQMPSHTHTIRTLNTSTKDDNAGAGGTFGSSNRNIVFSGVTPNPSVLNLYTGGNEAHNNVPPTFGLYVWQRTS